MDVVETGGCFGECLSRLSVEVADLLLVDARGEVGDDTASGEIAARASPGGVIFVSLLRKELRFSSEKGSFESERLQNLSADVHCLKVAFCGLFRKIGSQSLGNEELEVARECRSIFSIKVVIFAINAVVGELVAAALDHGASEVDVGESHFSCDLSSLSEFLRGEVVVVGTCSCKQDFSGELHFLILSFVGLFYGEISLLLPVHAESSADFPDAAR